MKPSYKLFKNFGYAFSGIAETFKTSFNVRIQSGFAVAAIVLGLFFQISYVEWLAIFTCMGLVIGGECINSAIENVVDLASPEIHPLAKSAKDMAAGGVLCFALGALAVGIMIFLPRILGLLLSILGM